MRVRLQELRRTFRLLNHGPTTLISAAAGGARNVMAAAWVMPIDFEPPKLAAVIAAETHTRKLIEASGEFVVCVPVAAQVDMTYGVGSCSGRDVDKFEKFSIATAPGALVEAPLIEGCAAWMECKVLDEAGVRERYDLVLAEVVAAWYDDELHINGDWRFDDPSRRTIHHLVKGRFFVTGDRISASGE